MEAFRVSPKEDRDSKEGPAPYPSSARNSARIGREGAVGEEVGEKGAAEEAKADLAKEEAGWPKVTMLIRRR